MKLSVVIPVYNEEKYIDACLEAIIHQSIAADEIIIVDNNCTDNTIRTAKKYPVKIVKESEQGMIPARNQGFNQAKYQIIARIDADTIVPFNWVKKIKSRFVNKNVVGVTGPAYFYDLPMKKLLSKTQILIYFRLVGFVEGHQLLFGSNMAITSSVWHKVKNSICNDSYEVHEDVDLSHYVNKYGKIVFDPRLYVSISSRRIKNPSSVSEYVLRYVKQSFRNKKSDLINYFRK